ncbi:ubiquinone/menaquinone biosynthesis methyltransferase [Pseudoramibacter alactolyticus ATCC 23263]|uniref:Demethylmenaquinone methyltransferase n=1 Tax=Pseudoramibacter alactolyticus ATCC 23263 TaxID=887929 RepID=E6MKE0_9FIRM|nr:ubiquinone/menaquinone biosynthesis methyltransferase [Pseudoramibacter alactolyticus]EFV00477.1 ubiquinone/menaquinone biosynthesis methyltransferase [Pseudoramibacter alactolyticus ATCC 23263]
MDVKPEALPAKRERVHNVFESISEHYDGGNRRISLGLQRRWKAALIAELAETTPPRQGVLDLCCGTGDIAIGLAERRPDLTITGVDFSENMLAVARQKTSEAFRARLHWTVGDAMHLDFPNGSFSAACIAFGLRNTEDYAQVLGEMRRVLVPGGRLYCLDSLVPEAGLVRPFYRLYFKHIMPILGGGSRHRQAYRWLWESTEQFLSKRDMVDLFQTIGLRAIGERSFLFGACMMFCGCK